MLRIIVLGSAAGGGVPQWNCGCAICTRARHDPSLQMTQCSLAVSADGEHWFVINASPDLRQQITRTAALQPRHGRLRHSPLTGVILTNGEIDSIAGLLSLREASPFTIYAHANVLAALTRNSMFNALRPDLVKRIAIESGIAFRPKLPGGKLATFTITPLTVPGKDALYDEPDPTGAAVPFGDGGTLGLKIVDNDGGVVCVISACADITPDLLAALRDADALFFDGTLWRDDEMVAAGLSHKSGRRMGHVSMSGPDGAIEMLASLAIRQKFFLHINNSNPVLLPDSAERRTVEEAGWRIPHDGMEIGL